MDGKLKDGRVGRLWMCKMEHGHVLGLCVRVSNGEAGAKIDKLLLFRHAVRRECLDEAQVIGAVEAMDDIECDICASKRTWGIGDASLERFLKSRKIKPLHFTST